jgi:hypothetical protein
MREVMQMTPQEELDAALAELAAAKAELAAAQAAVGEATAAAKGARPTRPPKKAAAKPKREKRPVHHTPGLQAGCSGTGERFTGTDKVRTDWTPVVTKERDPMARPNEYKREGIECLLVFDVKQGFMDSDSWKRCKCLGCVEIRRG